MLINNATHQSQTLSERPIRPPLKSHNPVKHKKKTYQLLCKKNYTTCVKLHTSYVLFLTQQLVGSSFISFTVLCYFLNSGLIRCSIAANYPAVLSFPCRLLPFSCKLLPFPWRFSPFPCRFLPFPCRVLSFPCRVLSFCCRSFFSFPCHIFVFSLSTFVLFLPHYFPFPCECDYFVLVFCVFCRVVKIDRK